MSDITKTNGKKLHEQIIAEIVVQREHESAHLHGLILRLSHQIVALRYFRDKYDISTGGGWMDTYTNRFDGLVNRMMEIKSDAEALQIELNAIEKEIFENIAKKAK